MSDFEIARVVTDILRAEDITQVELAARLGVTQPTVSRWLKGSAPEIEHRDRLLAEAMRLGIMNGTRPKRETLIVGHVGAGGEAHFSEAQGPLGSAPMPDGARDGTVAVVVRGDSMNPVAEDNWLLYYEDRRFPPTADLYGKLCVVGLQDGRILVKKLYRGAAPGLFNLLSSNAAPLLDQPVEWAAEVTWIKPR